MKSSTGRVFGAFVSVNLTSAQTWYNDPNSFMFQLDNLAKLPVKDPSYGSHVMGHSSYLLVFGGSGTTDLLINSGGSGTTTPGNSYANPVTPAGVLATGSAAGITYLHGSSANENFKLADMESWQLSPMDNGQLY